MSGLGMKGKNDSRAVSLLGGSAVRLDFFCCDRHPLQYVLLGRSPWTKSEHYESLVLGVSYFILLENNLK